MAVTNNGPVVNQVITENNYAKRPADHLQAARRGLDGAQWVQAAQSYEKYLAEEPAPAPDVRVEYALALLAGRRPRAHSDALQDRIDKALAKARHAAPESAPAIVLQAIFDEDIDHAFLHPVGRGGDQIRKACAELEPEWARRIVTTISVRESRTWQELYSLVTPDADTSFLPPPLSDAEQHERELRMRTLFTPAPAEPQPVNPVTAQPGVLLALVGAGALLIPLLVLRGVWSWWWEWFSPLPYVVVVGTLLLTAGLARAGWALAENHRQRGRLAAARSEHSRQMIEYEAALPTEAQVEGWVKRDVQFIRERALVRLGMVIDELSQLGRTTDPLIIVGPAKPTLTKIARHPQGGYFASHYSVFILCMTDRKLGAYSTVLNAITGLREPDEQTSEYRYQDIVSVSVRTVRLAAPTGQEKTSEESDLAYTFVDARPEAALAERFTLVVPGDRFVVTTRVSSEKDGTGSQIQFSEADRALAAIRRRILAAGVVSVAQV